jgi:hypothetical protein
VKRFVQYSRVILFLLCVATIASLAADAVAQQRKALQTMACAPANAQLLRRLPSSQTMQLAISLPLRNQAQLATLLQQLEDPSSPDYHRYLTVAQFTEQFGPPSDEYEQVIGFAQSHGLTVTHTSPNRLLLNVTGSVADIEQAFQVKMQVYQQPAGNRTYFAPDVEPTVDAGVPILSVSGLTDRVQPHSMLVHAPAGKSVHSDQTGSGQGGQFLGSDIRAAYYGSGPLTGSGEALALAELGQWNMADVTAYFSTVGQPLDVPIVTELLGGTSGTCNDCDDGEEVIDIQQIISMAPEASVLIVYEDTSNNADIDIFNAYATDDIARQMSFSFGIGDGNDAADQQAFAEFHAQGQNFFVASGDAGANLGDGGWPGFSPDVTDVGGTDLTTASAGGSWSVESGWVGSGAGWCDSSNINSPCYPSSSSDPSATIDAIPGYQSSPSTMLAAITSNGGSSQYRNVPDVAAEANTDNFFCSSGSCQGGIGGTSLAAPRWAGFLALANEQAAANGESIGFLNPLVYTVGQGTDYDTAFHDITSGSNPSGSTVPSWATGSFTATTGFDMVTGWGTPNGQGFIDALAPVSTTNPFFTLTASPATLNLTPGGAPGTATISLTAGNGFTGSVALTATAMGAPAGVTVNLNPATITGSGTSTLTVTTTSATPAGTLMVTVTGTSAGGIQTQPAFVTLQLPDFSLSTTPGTIYLNQSATATSTVTVNAQNGFSGAVDLSLSGLPTGVTGSFNPTSTTSGSTLTLKATSTAATVAGAYLTVSGTAGGISPLSAPYTFVSVSAATGTGGSGTPVNLNSAYNLPALYIDGTTFTTGMDGAGSGYSATLLTPNRILSGVQFNFGPANTTNCGGSGQPVCANDAISSAAQDVSLPSGQFTTLQLLATAIDGPVLAQPIKVTYTDGTTSTFTQNFSDWCSCSQSSPGPGQQPGESYAVAMPYRDTATGATQDLAFNLYAYTLVLNNAKTVKTLTLPPASANGAVIVLAATLTSQPVGTQVDLSSGYNVAGLFDNGITFPATGGMDGGGDACTLAAGCSDAYSAQQLGLSTATPPTLFTQGLVFNFGPVNASDCGGSAQPACVLDMVNLNPGVTITLPTSQQTSYATMTLLGTGVQGSHTGTVTITYTTGAPVVFNQTFDDWCGYSGSISNESIAIGGFSRINSDGTLSTGVPCNLYAYTYSLDSTRIVQSIALENTDSTNYSLALALTLSGNTSAVTPGYTLSASPNAINVVQQGSNTSTITVTPSGGFTGSVSLSASGLPNGVTASFNPSSTATTSVLTLSANSSASLGGPTPITITGASGTLSETTTVNVTVVAPPNFTLTNSGNITNLTPGTTTGNTATITITPTNGFTGTVDLQCTVTAPAGAIKPVTCSIPSSVSISGATAQTALLTVDTTATTGSLSNSRLRFWSPQGGTALALVLFFGVARRRRKSATVLALLMIVILGAVSGCVSHPRSGGTTAGNYTITVTGTAGAITQTTILTVTVN